MTAGTLTFRSNDGYVVEAPVEAFEVVVEDDYSASGIDWLLDTSSISLTPYTVNFNATLAYGKNYTVRDMGVDIEKTLTVKGSKGDDKTLRSAMGVPADAKVRYLEKNDVTKFTWNERVIVDEG